MTLLVASFEKRQSISSVDAMNGDVRLLQCPLCLLGCKAPDLGSLQEQGSPFLAHGTRIRIMYHGGQCCAIIDDPGEKGRPLTVCSVARDLSLWPLASKATVRRSIFQSTLPRQGSARRLEGRPAL